MTNPRHDTSLFFAKRVEELSKGEVKIEVFPAGVLGSHQSCQEQVSVGALDFYITTAGLVSVFDPMRTQELIELPYLFDTYSQAYAFMDTPYVAKFYEPLKAKGIHYLATWDNGFRHMTNNVRPILTPQDMKGLKVRVVQSEMSINILNALGASAVPMSYSELYQALQQGVVDGQEKPLREHLGFEVLRGSKIHVRDQASIQHTSDHHLRDDMAETQCEASRKPFRERLLKGLHSIES